MNHLLRHLGLVVVGLVVLPVFGVPWQTALYVGLMAGCVLVAFGGGHTGHVPGKGVSNGSQEMESHHH